MIFLTVLEIFNYGLVLIFGLFLSTLISGGWESPRQKLLVIALCPVFLLIQGIFYLLWNVSTVERLYPLIVHLPLVLILVLVLKRRVGIALVSVSTAYLCCQLPRWAMLSILALTGSPVVGEISYTLFIVPVYLLLRRHFVHTAHNAMVFSTRSLYLFGSLPMAYYIFDYCTTVYADFLPAGIQALNEFLPTALIIFYLIFLTAYYAQVQERVQADLRRSMLEAELKQSGIEIESLRQAATQTAIYQHDMRHHLNAIEGFLSAGEPERAEAYIKSVHADVDAISPKRFCENELINLLCSSFAAKAAQLGIRFSVDAELPRELPISDTELCSILSNALENAFHGVSDLESYRQRVELYCCVKLSKLLIEVKNPCKPEIPMQDGLPVSDTPGHGYGCRSIRTIAEQHRGICTFEPEHGTFTFRVMIPMSAAASAQSLP